MKPILFSTPMVQAILAGRKTQTRRVITDRNSVSGIKLSELVFDQLIIETGKENCQYFKAACMKDETVHRVFPRWEPGDVFWVREKFKKLYNCKTGEFACYWHYADMPEDFHQQQPQSKWMPSIHMPFEACRLFLKIKSIRVERLQDITEEDVKAEGVEFVDDRGIIVYKSYLAHEPYHWSIATARKSFETLWQKINGIESWNANPWVWVIEFERTEKPTT